jgi:hypothetical protein
MLQETKVSSGNLPMVEDNPDSDAAPQELGNKALD